MEDFMDLDDILIRVKALIAQRETLDAELAELFSGSSPSKRKSPVCSQCGQAGHRATTCTNPPSAEGKA